MPEITLLQHLVVAALICVLYYAAFAITIVGFAMMLGGVNAAQATAQLLFALPLQTVFAAFASGLVALAAATAQVVAGLGRAVVRYVVDPVLRPIAYLIRVIIAGPPA